jgi:phage recombination protein Bet
MGALVPQQQTAVAVSSAYSPDQIELLKRTVCKGATDDEFALFGQLCRRTGLDPFSRQIHAVKRRQRDEETGQWVNAMTFMVGIDGFRLVAERTGRYEGQTPPMWCGEDGVWKDVWTPQSAPFAARVGVYRTGAREATFGVAHYSEYCQVRNDGTPIKMWGKMACQMLAKCAEAQALRKAFPQELSGCYEPEEMKHREVVDIMPHDVSAAQDAQTDEMSKALAAFAEIKAKLGAERYYTILGSEGYEHANEIKAIKDRRRIYSLMLSESRLREAAHE